MLTVYTSPSCYPCKAVIKRLQSAQIPHTVVDLSQDQESYDFVTQTLKQTQTPVITYQPEPHTDDQSGDLFLDGLQVYDAATVLPLIQRLSSHPSQLA